MVSNVSSAVSADSLTNTSSTKALTMSEVAKHSNGQSCWMVISGKVYDVTSYQNKHPGGSYNLLSFCGQDATSAFDSVHNSRGYSVLNSFYIGDLSA